MRAYVKNTEKIRNLNTLHLKTRNRMNNDYTRKSRQVIAVEVILNSKFLTHLSIFASKKNIFLALNF